MTAGSQLDPTPAETEATETPQPAPQGAWRRLAGVGLTIAAVLCWAGIVITAIALVTTIAGFTLTPLHAVFQMALPYVAVVLAVPLLFAALTHRRGVAVAAGVLLVATVLLVVPAALPGDAPSPSPDDLTVFVANVRYNNDIPDQKTDQLLSRDEDVLVVLELTPDFLTRLDVGGMLTTHPFRMVDARWGAHGAGIFSKVPLDDARREPIGELNAPAATVNTTSGPLRIVAVHTRPPVTDEYVPVWRDDLNALRNYARGLSIPTVLAGDYNATRWHPGFRNLLDLGLRDAHEQLGHGLSFSWPETGRLGGVVAPFSRLDHALLFDTDATATEEVPAVGSDHAAFSVRVRPRHPDTVDP